MPTVEQSITSYAYGTRTYTCLSIDNGIVPLMAPDDTQVVGVDGEVKIVWSKTNSAAIFRSASAQEIALLGMMGRPEAPAEWQKFIAASAQDVANKPTLHDFQPNILAVNHWHIGTVSLDYTLGGVRYGWLLLLWQCADGKAIEVTLRCDYSYFQSQVNELYSMIGSAMLMQK